MAPGASEALFELKSIRHRHGKTRQSRRCQNGDGLA